MCRFDTRIPDETESNSAPRIFPMEVIFLIQEIFLKRELTDIQMIHQRMKRLLPGYVFLSDGYTGGIAIPEGVQYSNPILIDRPNSRKNVSSSRLHTEAFPPRSSIFI